MPSALAWDQTAVQDALALGDVLVFQRNVIVREVWDAMDYWRAIGKLILVDLDDHYPHLPGSNPAHTYWIRNRPGLEPEPVAALTEGLRHADYLTSPSKVILADWAHVVPGMWLPNYTRQKWYAPLAQKPVGAPDPVVGYEMGEDGQPRLAAKPRAGSEGWVVLGWGGSISHVDSWLYSGVVDALDRIFEKYPHVRLKFCGNESRLDFVLNRWGERVIRQTGVRPEDWPSVVSTFDIGLAPLDTRPLDPPWREGAPLASYDERRSWLKAIEYLSAGVPWVASRSLTYSDLGRWGTLVPNTAEEWFEALDRKIENIASEKALAWDRRRWAFKNVTFESQAQRYCETLGRMLAEKQSQAGAKLPGVVYTTKKADGQNGVAPAAGEIAQTPAEALAGAAT